MFHSSCFRNNIYIQHARRLFPLKLTMKDTIEWGYNTEKEGSDWTVLDKNIENNEIDDKKIGFEGTPDPKTGYYCVSLFILT